MPMGIGAVGGGIPGLGSIFPGAFMPPMGAAIWNEIPKPNRFEDQSSQWNQFDREWRKYENLTASTGYPFPDALKLEILKN